MLTRADLKSYCLQKRATVEEYPFDATAAVYKVLGKMFALIADDAIPPSISLKCDPAHAIYLRATYPAVTGGYHLNKKHWNTVKVDGTIPDEIVQQMIDHSYDLVVKGLPKADREKLASMG